MMSKDFSKINLEQLCVIEALEGDYTSTFIGFANCIDDFIYKEDLNESQENADDNLDKILPT